MKHHTTKQRASKKASNKTQKVRALPSLTNEERQLVCKQYNDNLNTFEKEFEKATKKDLYSAKYRLEDNIIKNLKKAVSITDIKPQDDFYSYINERWLVKEQSNEKQKYIVQVDNFRLVQDKVYYELVAIIEEYISKEKSKKSECLKKFYKSQLKLNSNEQSSSYAKRALANIDNFRKDKAGLWKFMGFVNRNEIIAWGCPFFWSVIPDEKQPKIFRSHISSPQFSLIDLNVYFDDGTDVEYKAKYKRNFFHYLENIFRNALGPNHGFNVKDVFDIELKMISLFGCDTKIKGSEDNYNRVTRKEALHKFGFNWNEFSEGLGYKETPDFFISGNLSYLKCASDLLVEEWNNDQWRTYWIYIFIRQQQRWNARGLENDFEFNAKFQRGAEKMVDRKIGTIWSMGFAFNTFLTNEYVTRYENKQYVNYVKTLAEDLKTVFTRIIMRNKWMKPSTKDKALLKLKKFDLTVGSPKLIREDPLLVYDENDAYGNVTKLSNWRYFQSMKLEGKPVIDIPYIDWAQSPPKFIGTQAFVVNASYTPSKNGIYIPLGYIQKPFVDLDERGIEWNLAHIGNTLGHEMSHALDNWGSKYDADGVLNDWWTDSEKKIYDKIQKDVILQYETYAKRDGIIFDAEPSIGEDLADISGLAICLEYLENFQSKNQDILPIQSLSFEAFFAYFAFQQRQKVSKKALQAQLKTNPHPLDKYRTNVPLSRLKVFRTIANVKKGDGMWWHSTNKVWQD
jgi:predicted metalloendopeptidase